jgi:hypothetical protein
MAGWDGKQDVGALTRRMRDRISATLKGRAATEKRMFGGVCFLLNGNMLCGSGKNGFMFRVGADADAAHLPGARPLVMQGRAMKGFFWVDPDACDDAALGGWIALADAYVAAMPPKAVKAKKARG